MSKCQLLNVFSSDMLNNSQKILSTIEFNIKSLNLNILPRCLHIGPFGNNNEWSPSQYTGISKIIIKSHVDISEFNIKIGNITLASGKNIVGSNMCIFDSVLLLSPILSMAKTDACINIIFNPQQISPILIDFELFHTDNFDLTKNHIVETSDMLNKSKNLLVYSNGFVNVVTIDDLKKCTIL